MEGRGRYLRVFCIQLVILLLGCILSLVEGRLLLYGANHDTRPVIDLDVDSSVAKNITHAVWDLYSINVTDGVNHCAAQGFPYIKFEAWDMNRIAALSNHELASNGGDMLLVVGEGERFASSWQNSPPMTLSTNVANWQTAANSYADISSFQLLKPFHAITRRLNGGVDIYTIAVYNVELWLQRELQYKLQASCRSSLENCPSPFGPGTPPCGGQGTCNGRCWCDQGFAGLGCEHTLRILDQNDEFIPDTVMSGKWKHYAIYADSPDPDFTTEVEVNMIKRNGDLVLFMKKIAQGHSPYDVPNVYDYSTYGDVTAYQYGSQFHARKMLVTEPETYLVSVFNNGARDGSFDIKKKYITNPVSPDTPSPGPTPGPDVPAVPSVPNPPVGPGEPDPISREIMCSLITCQAEQGECVIENGSPVCKCNAGFVGESCLYRLLPMNLAQHIVGFVPGNSWDYYALDLRGPSPDNVFSVNPMGHDILISFNHYGGAASLFVRRNIIPTDGTNDYIFMTPYLNNFIRDFKISKAEATPGIYYFGIQNSDALSNSMLHYSFKVSLNKGGTWFPQSVLHISMGIFAAICVLTIFLIYKKVMQRNSNISFVQAVLNAAAAFAGGPGDNQNQQSSPGLETSVIESFEKITFSEGLHLKGGETCMICLAEYEAGDELRQMPGCQHTFHIKCIDPWLSQSHSCPTCRADLRNNPEEGEQQGENVIDVSVTDDSSVELSNLSPVIVHQQNFEMQSTPNRLLESPRAGTSDGRHTGDEGNQVYSPPGTPEEPVLDSSSTVEEE